MEIHREGSPAETPGQSVGDRLEVVKAFNLKSGATWVVPEVAAMIIDINKIY